MAISPAASSNRFASLPLAERQVIELALAGLPNKVIAGRLAISLRTVERRRASALRRLGIATLVEAARLRPETDSVPVGLGGFDAVFTDAAAPVAVADRSGRFVAVNAGMCELIGATEADLLALRLQDVIHPDDRQDSLDDVRRLFAGEIPGYRARRRLLTGSGGAIRAEIAVAPIWSRDGIPAFGLGQVIATDRAA
jgi:PAS domain S-box-containing protein